MSIALQVAYDVIVPIFLVAALGFWFGRRFSPDTRTLSRAAIYQFLPALVFKSSANSTLDLAQIGQIILFALLLFGSMTLIGSLLARTQKSLPAATKSAFTLSVVMPNAVNYGLPFIGFAFGDAGLQIATLMLVMNSIMSNTLCIYLASSGTATLRQGIRNILSVPMVYATVLGFVVKFAGIELPVPLTRAVDLLSGAAVPIMLLLLGVQLSHIRLDSELRATWRALGLASMTRLLVAPAVILLVTTLMGIDGLTRNVLLVQFSTPTAVYSTLLATEFGSDARFATAVVLITTLASIFTLSAIMALFVG